MVESSPRESVSTLQSLHQRAREETGLSDFGDEAYLTSLKFLLKSYDRESKLGEHGRDTVESTIVGALKGRLFSTENIRRNPGCLDREIVKPLFVIGLPRTGTTALHKLLAAAPNTQALEYWLACTPDVRPPREQWKDHPQYIDTVQSLARVYDSLPEYRSIHSMLANEADECRLLFLQDFTGMTFSSNATIPSFEKWVLEQDMVPAYLRYRDNLKLIGAREPEKRWVLKNSAHLWALNALHMVFADACIVHPHRHPLEFIVSTSSLVYRLRAQNEPGISKQEVGLQQLNIWAKIIEINMQQRRDNPGLNIIDIDYKDFVAAPVETVKKIYQHFDMPWSPQVEIEVGQWAAENAKDKHGVHEYSMEEYGLTEEMIAENFSSYIDEYELQQ